jgi:hypothetical protein
VHVACCHSRCIGCTRHLVAPAVPFARCQASREESAAIPSFESLDDAEQFDVVLASDVLYEDVQVRLDQRSVITLGAVDHAWLCGGLALCRVLY